MKVAIVTNAIYQTEPLFVKYTDTLKQRYCDKHEMSYCRYSYNPDPSMSPLFCKFDSIRKALKEGNDWVIWMDCDAAPVTMEVDIIKWLSKKEQKVIMLKDALGWNAGVFAVPNCEKAFKWLDWLNTKENKKKFDKGYRDQDEMAYTFATIFSSFIHEDGYDFGFNNYDDIYPHKNKPNLFVKDKSWCLHIPGKDEHYRNDRFGNIIRELDGLPPIYKVRKDSLNGRTVKDYIDEGAKTILIDYPHGLGDLIMFYPHAKHFAEENNVRIDIKPHDAFRTLLSTEYLPQYDVTIYFPARFNERESVLKGKTKPECNVVYDLGGTYDASIDYTAPIVVPLSDRNRSRLVGFNFCCSYYPNECNCPEITANLLWNRVIAEGFIPFEVFVAKTNRPENKKFPFVRLSMRDVGPGIDRMMSIMSALKGVASVSTGTWHYGMAAYPETTLYLQNAFKATCYTRKPALVLDVNKPDQGVINEWISRLKEKDL